MISPVSRRRLVAALLSAPAIVASPASRPPDPPRCDRPMVSSVGLVFCSLPKGHLPWAEPGHQK